MQRTIVATMGCTSGKHKWRWKCDLRICISISIYAPPYPTSLSLSDLCLYHRLHLYLAPSPYDPHPDLQEGLGFRVQCLEFKVRDGSVYGDRDRSRGRRD